MIVPLDVSVSFVFCKGFFRVSFQRLGLPHLVFRLKFETRVQDAEAAQKLEDSAGTE